LSRRPGETLHESPTHSRRPMSFCWTLSFFKNRH
jgi:hypothetical protein